MLTLKRGDAVNRAARPEWDDSYWGYWAGIRQIWVGGGVLSGRLGPLAVEAAAAMLVAGGVTDCTVTLAAQPGILPLLGAARAVPPGSATAAVLDFGGTAIKRGIASTTSARRRGCGCCLRCRRSSRRWRRWPWRSSWSAWESGWWGRW